MPSDLPKGIGPHEGRELELMLAGEKPLATFVAEDGLASEHVGDSAFAPHVAAGTIKCFTLESPEGFTPWMEVRAYCLPGEEWRAKLVMEHWKRAFQGRSHEVFSPEDLHRMFGSLLGYAKADVELFIERMRDRSGTP